MCKTVYRAKSTLSLSFKTVLDQKHFKNMDYMGFSSHQFFAIYSCCKMKKSLGKSDNARNGEILNWNSNKLTQKQLKITQQHILWYGFQNIHLELFRNWINYILKINVLWILIPRFYNYIIQTELEFIRPFCLTCDRIFLILLVFETSFSFM